MLLLPCIASAQFYYPDHKNYGSPSDYGLKYEDVHFPSDDGTQLHGWHIQARSKHRIGTIIHFHGNAQNMSAHFHGVEWLAERGFDLFLFDYRGYGESAGSPSRDGVFEDCVAAIQAAQKLSSSENHFIVYGQSLGAANAIAVTGERKFPKIAGVVAEAPFYSYKSIARDKVDRVMDILVGVVISNRKSPHRVVQNISPVPLLIIHGTGDRVIPFSHSQKLFEKAKEPKRFWKVPGAGHMRIFQDRKYQDKLVDTLQRWIKAADAKV